MELESHLKCKFNQLPWQTAIKTFAEFSFGPQGDPPNILQLLVVAIKGPAYAYDCHVANVY